ncbi:Dpc7p KNAG_0H00500 [Huiozyma naganishii CBS 8797]|uniref:Uncharacterized protein n=1 Tax=Huiozyma naganishii (strain ATCC MYA-139 / BCRC 22969 / CBS 8797 / KCTC 17520 / NBRC 10181 / NCYC 3082 / Yp74L-3) TaxID=1071383 RepID=J7S9F9_HUIN7|nr:hypothetical protein KNAG_0H00500 [Kazachstania naganishii CBS 8797]CCK71466.1 hypothetical protein KNAG_0H00500 [Kazachstania naganishii CBS 8797]
MFLSHDFQQRFGNNKLLTQTTSRALIAAVAVVVPYMTWVKYINSDRHSEIKNIYRKDRNL